MINATQLREGHLRVLYTGLAFNLLLPIAMVLSAVGIRRIMAGAEGWGTDPATLRILFWAFLGVAALEFPVALLVRRLTLKPNMRSAETDEAGPALSFVLSRYLVLFALAVTPSFYGFVHHLLGGTLQDLILFAVLSLVIYRFIRPSQEFYYSLFGARPPGAE